MRPELNQIYVYQPSEKIMEGMFKKLSHRHVNGQVMYYVENGSNGESDDVHRYAITVKVNDVNRTVLLLTRETSKKIVGAALKATAEQIEKSPALLATFVKATGKPTKLGIAFNG